MDKIKYKPTIPMLVLDAPEESKRISRTDMLMLWYGVLPLPAAPTSVLTTTHRRRPLPSIVPNWIAFVRCFLVGHIYEESWDRHCAACAMSKVYMYMNRQRWFGWMLKKAEGQGVFAGEQDSTGKGAAQ